MEAKASKRKAASVASRNGRALPHDVRDLGLAEAGRRRIEWADEQMPVLRLIRERFAKEKPLRGQRLSACLHVTTETANLLRTLKAGGAEVLCCASNPLSTQDDVAAALVKEYGIPTYAVHAEDRDTYYSHLRAVLEAHPTITMDDGADLVSLLHTEFHDQAAEVRASMEETTTGVIRLRAMEQDHALRIPVVAVNDAQTKYLFDNRYGTGQSTLDAIIRATGVLVAGSVIVVCGYGWCGRGVASRARGLGANVIVTEVNPIRALEAALDGYQVKRMAEAAREGDIFITVTGDKDIIGPNHMTAMKDGAIICNSGHFDVEIDLPALRKLARRVDRHPDREVETFHLRNGRKLYLLGQGRLVNLACAGGHPAQVMDMSFATQAMAAAWASQAQLEVKVHNVPLKIEDEVASMKLTAMGIKIDRLSAEQKHYLASWQTGT
ncbi:MAG TPA: adenosylhomocysteinase [Candidatus Binataceae bacterium]|jgi:adenosylhomocysteinase|nr:adenosylhomocysteinase [Candidatus Binataceae bacterium]